MIDLYTWSTPNGYKVAMMLEEIGFEYRVHPINLSEGEQHSREFLALSPNGKIPAIKDGDITVFDSGAILIYLAEKSGKLLPQDAEKRALVLQWLMFQMAHVGPMIGQLAWFTRSAPQEDMLAIDRYLRESARLMNVLDAQLAHREYVADEFSIADIALYGWVSMAIGSLKELAPNIDGDWQALERWLEIVGQRPATQKGMCIPAAPD